MARRLQSGEGERGFTVTEMLVVLVIVGLVAGIAVPNVSSAIRRAEETALRENLQVMRRALDDYFADKGAYPAALDALVDEKYIRFVPDDPVGEAGASWDLVRGDAGGIMDVRSGSQEVGLNDVAYREW